MTYIVTRQPGRIAEPLHSRPPPMPRTRNRQRIRAKFQPA